MSSDECLGDLMKCDSYSRVAASGSFITIMEERPYALTSEELELETFETDEDSTLNESSDEKEQISPKRAAIAAQPYDPFQFGDNGEVAVHHRAGLSDEAASTSPHNQWKEQRSEWHETCEELTNLTEFSDIVKNTNVSIPWAGVTQSEGDLERYRRAEKANTISWGYTSDSESPASSTSSSCDLETNDEPKPIPTYPIKEKRCSKIPRYRGNLEPRPGAVENSSAADFEVFTALQFQESPRKETKSTFGDTLQLSVPNGSERKHATTAPSTAKGKAKPHKAQKGPVKSKKRHGYHAISIKPIYKARSDFDVSTNFERDNPLKPTCCDRQPQVVHSHTQTLGALIVVDPMKACRKSDTTYATVGGDSSELIGSGSVGVIECSHPTSDGEQAATPPSFAKRTQNRAKSPRSNAMQVQPFATSSETHSSRENSPRRRRSCRASKTLYADLRSVLIRFLCFWMILLVCLALYHSANIQEYFGFVYTALRAWYYPQKPPLTPRQKIAKGVKTILGLFKL